MAARRTQRLVVTLPFPHRDAAGEQLATLLEGFAPQRPLVLGIPGSGMAVARAVAGALGAELDAVLVRRLRSSAPLERTLGAMDDAGWSGVPADERERRLLVHEIGWVERVGPWADAVACLATPLHFAGIGRYYLDRPRNFVPPSAAQLVELNC